MSSLLLAIPHRTEAFAGACLPACLQMALAYFGVNRSQEQIARQIGHVAGASELPYWEHDTAHAVLVAGMEQAIIWVHDPAFDKAPIPVPVDDLSLAWYEMGNTWAQVAGQSS